MRTYRSAMELRRIEIAGGMLSDGNRAWLATQLEQFQDLSAMSRVDAEFPVALTAEYAPLNPDTRYDLLSGLARLDALEAAFTKEGA